LSLGAFEDSEGLLLDLRTLFRQGPYCFLRHARDILNGDSRRSHRKFQDLPQGRASRFFQWHFTQVDHSRPTVSLSWNKAPIWDLRPNFCCCQTVVCLSMWGALSARVTVNSNKSVVLNVCIYNI
jgi:hypothetical protein